MSCPSAVLRKRLLGAISCPSAVLRRSYKLSPRCCAGGCWEAVPPVLRRRLALRCCAGGERRLARLGCVSCTELRTRAVRPGRVNKSLVTTRPTWTDRIHYCIPRVFGSQSDFYAHRQSLGSESSYMIPYIVSSPYGTTEPRSLTSARLPSLARPLACSSSLSSPSLAFTLSRPRLTDSNKQTRSYLILPKS